MKEWMNWERFWVVSCAQGRAVIDNQNEWIADKKIYVPTASPANRAIGPTRGLYGLRCRWCQCDQVGDEIEVELSVEPASFGWGVVERASLCMAVSIFDAQTCMGHYLEACEWCETSIDLTLRYDLNRYAPGSWTWDAVCPVDDDGSLSSPADRIIDWPSSFGHSTSLPLSSDPTYCNKTPTRPITISPALTVGNVSAQKTFFILSTRPTILYARLTS